MFKALAEFAMRGRNQAILLALLGSWIPFISQAVLGLVTLRRGWAEGSIIMIAACLPAILGIWIGNVGLALVLATVAIYIVSWLVCVVLRATINWSTALMASVALAVLSSLLIVTVDSGVVARVTEFFEQLYANSESQEVPAQAQWLMQWTPMKAAGLLSYWMSFSVVIGLLIARWWQALLYNPGGFRQEFHQLRLPLPMALVCGLAVLYCSSQGGSYQFWGAAFGLPLLFAGLGLVHWLIGRFRLGIAGLVLLYICLPLVNPVPLIIMFLALIDASLDLRKKLSSGQSDQG